MQTKINIFISGMLQLREQTQHSTVVQNYTPLKSFAVIHCAANTRCFKAKAALKYSPRPINERKHTLTNFIILIKTQLFVEDVISLKNTGASER